MAKGKGKRKPKNSSATSGKAQSVKDTPMDIVESVPKNIESDYSAPVTKEKNTESVSNSYESPVFAGIPDDPDIKKVATDCDTGIGRPAANILTSELHESPVGEIQDEKVSTEALKKVCVVIEDSDPVVGATLSPGTTTPSLEPASGTEPEEFHSDPSEPVMGSDIAEVLIEESGDIHEIVSEPDPSSSTSHEVGVLRGHGYRYIALAIARLVGLVERGLVHTREEIGRGCGIKKSLLRMVVSSSDSDIFTYVRSVHSELSGKQHTVLAETSQTADDEQGSIPLLPNPNDVSKASDIDVLKIVVASVWRCAWASWQLLTAIGVTILCSSLRAGVAFTKRLVRRWIDMVAWMVLLPIYLPLYIIKAVLYRIVPSLANTHTAVVSEECDSM